MAVRKNVESSRRQNTDDWVQKTESQVSAPSLQGNCYNKDHCLAIPGGGTPHIHHPSGDDLHRLRADALQKEGTGCPVLGGHEDVLTLQKIKDWT